MKQYRKVLLILSACVVFFSTTTWKSFAAPIVTYSAEGGALYSLTSLPDLVSAIQTGWDAKLAMTVESSDVFAPVQGLDGTWNSSPLALSGRIQADIFGFNASLPQSDGNLYRAWQGMGFSLSGGLRSPAFGLPLLGWRASATIEAGAGLRATKYTGTGLVSANPAIVAQAGLDISILKHLALGICLPFEFAWKSGGTAVMFGVGAALRYR